MTDFSRSRQISDVRFILEALGIKIQIVFLSYDIAQDDLEKLWRFGMTEWSITASRMRIELRWKGSLPKLQENV